MIDEFSIIMPCEEDRVPLLLKTLGEYKRLGLPKKIEFIIVSRTIKEFAIPGYPIKLVTYDWEGEYFCPSKALNLGVKNAQYQNIIVTCPEVIPVTNVLQQLCTQVRGNYMCKCQDEDASGKVFRDLISSTFRCDPSMYFLACFKKEDIEAINGWDEAFMGGYAFEDTDFGNRFLRAGLKFTMKDGIVGKHQFHPREQAGTKGWSKNSELQRSNDANNVIRPIKGLEDLE